MTDSSSSYDKHTGTNIEDMIEGLKEAEQKAGPDFFGVPVMHAPHLPDNAIVVLMGSVAYERIKKASRRQK